MEKTTDPLLFSRFQYFAQCTSHTLSDPVRKILAVCESSKDVGVIEKEAQNLLETIKALRKYSFFVINPPKFRRIKTLFAVEEALDILSDNGVEAKKFVSFDRESMPEIVADATQITDVFVELIENAIKFCKTTPAIKIQYQDLGDHHVFAVANNAGGISTPYLNKIFTLSVRGDNSDGVSGEGIGLACVEAIAGNHEGKAWAKSKDGQGSIFYVSISKGLRIKD